VALTFKIGDQMTADKPAAAANHNFITFHKGSGM
jgi:hypothetical protein